MMIIKLAWRNIWRNRRRSSIILASVIIGLAATVFSDNVMRGFVQQTFENQLGASTGHIQVHAPEFRDNQIIENFIDDAGPIRAVLDNEPAIMTYAERVLANGIVSTARNSTGARIVGIIPEQETRVSTISSMIIEGTFLTGSEREVLLSARLAKTLDVRLGERVVAMAANAEGSVGSDVFTVVGIYRSPNAAFDKVNLFVPSPDLQRMLGVGSRIAEIAMLLHDSQRANVVAERLQKKMGDTYEVLPYRDLLPAMVAYLEITEQSMAIFYAIIGLAMIFGIANTMLMSVFERINEFGVIKSIGLKDRSLFMLVITEAAILGFLGIVGGALFGMLLTAPFFSSGINFGWFSEGLRAWGIGAIIYPVVDPLGILEGLLVIEIVAICAAIFPAIRAMRLLPIDAMRHV
jgi:ABC-type lipoprotein release transport system permease subunit